MSKPLARTKQNYAQIEMRLAGCSYFHEYVHLWNATSRSDAQKLLNQVQARLQKWPWSGCAEMPY